MTIRDAIQYYKSNIDRYWKQENYKWTAIAWFGNKWNANAKDFSSMLEEALKYADNLLQGGNYYPKSTICALAKVKPEEVRALFIQLFDESKPLSERIKSFQSRCDDLLTYLRENVPGYAKAKNHYQDLRAICVYLSFQYPQKYFLYKARMYSAFKKLVGYVENSREKDYSMRKYENFERLCQAVIEEAKKDAELITMQQQRVNEDKTYYPDPNLHLLAQTIIWVFPNIKEELDYWPSKEEYDPGISTEKWIDILSDPNVTSMDNLEMFSMILDYGMAATCTQLAETYDKDKNYFNAGSSSYAEKVAKKTGCPLPPEKEENARWWPILYVGRKATKDEKGTYVWKLRDELKAALEQIELPEVQEKTEVEDVTNKVEHDLNMILYGPPGTGKTYNTIVYSVAIIEERDFEEVSKEAAINYDEVKRRYNGYKDAGQIAFTTFHQSYGYEEFIEGIRPVLSEKQGESEASHNVEYVLHDGIFKEFCDRASRPVIVEQELDLGLNRDPVVWKVSLESTGENETRRECLENNHIRIGWDEYGPIIDDKTKYAYGGEKILDAFINQMRVGDVVVSCYSNSVTDAIGVIEGDYEWVDSYRYYRRVRRVRWLVKNIRENILQINNGTNMTRPTVYRLKISLNDVLAIVKKYSSHSVVEQTRKFVFIIDEINRGNISKIFGELITLIEKTKRIGKKEEMQVRLPYSGNLFGVPANVYILGTMNTADRSIALMDTALRRRFSFVEMMPKKDILEGIVIKSDGQLLNVSDMLDVINQRIEFLYDREHMIGHAFFTELRDNPSIELLASIFEKSVIPLLQEYFYEDYEKIQMVLGDDGKRKEEHKQYQFIQDIEVNPAKLFNSVPEIETKDKKYMVQKDAFTKIQSYKMIGKGL